MGFIVAAVIAVTCGGYIGVAWDRYQRRHDDHRPLYQRQRLTRQQLERLHIVDDEHTRRWDEHE